MHPLNAAVSKGNIEEIETLASGACAQLDSCMTGSPEDWDLLDPDRPDLRWFEGAPDDMNEATRRAGLMGGYARIILYFALHVLRIIDAG